MFFRAALYTSIFACLLTLLCLFKVAWLRPSDIEAYRAFSRKTREIASSKSYIAADQKRENVRKDIWIAQPDHLQLHTRIDSEASTLTLLPSDEKVDIIENLEKIRCWMQDRLYADENNPMQLMRYFEAKTGTYQYTTQQFVAGAVAMSLFRLPGHALPLSPDAHSAYLQGIAKNVAFSVAGKSPKLQADQFQATLKNQETVR